MNPGGEDGRDLPILGGGGVVLFVFVCWFLGVVYVGLRAELRETSPGLNRPQSGDDAARQTQGCRTLYRALRLVAC